MNLLVVDDEYYIVQGITSCIDCKKLGIDAVFSAYSADQAKKVIQKERIDILITDIEMPLGSGLSLIEWIQEQHYSIITLILTGHQRFDYAHKAIALHCFGYILKPADKAAIERELRKALASLSEEASSPAASQGSSAPAAAFSANDRFIQTVREFVLQNISSPDLSRNSLADYVHMNPDYLSSLFHDKFGQTLSAYITQVRIDRAKELLANSALSLNEISEKTGFSSSSYFHKQFKKTTGYTPQQYRALHLS